MKLFWKGTLKTTWYEYWFEFLILRTINVSLSVRRVDERETKEKKTRNWCLFALCRFRLPNHTGWRKVGIFRSLNSFIYRFFFFLTNGRTKYSITRELTVTCFLSADRSLISTKMRLNWPKARYEPSSILLLGWLQCPPFPLHQSATPTWFFFSLFLFFSFYLSISLSLPPPPPPPPPLPLPIIRNFENSVSFPCLFVTLHWSWWRPTRPIC